MTARSARLPSVGFAAVVLSIAGTAAFFAWGLSQPPLDRVWELHHLMKIGEMARLTKEDHRLLSEQMREHPDLAGDLLDGGDIGLISANLDGWLHVPGATLLRTARSGAVRALVVDVHTPEDLLPMRLELRGDGWRETREATGHGAMAIPLPPPKDRAEIIELRLAGKRLEADPSMLGLRVTWEAAK